jgi:hypothetical protein
VRAALAVLAYTALDSDPAARRRLFRPPPLDARACPGVVDPIGFFHKLSDVESLDAVVVDDILAVPWIRLAAG